MGLSLSLLSSAWNQILRPTLLGVLTAATIGRKAVVRSQSFGRNINGGGGVVDLRRSNNNNSFKKQDLMESSSDMMVGSQDVDKALVRSMSFKDWGLSSSSSSTAEDDDVEEEEDSSSTKRSVVDNRRDVGSCKKSTSSSSLVHEALILSIKKPAALLVPEAKVFFSPRPVSELDAAATTLQKVYKSYRTRRNLADCAVVVEELWWKALDSVALKKDSILFFDGEKHETASSKWSRATKRVAKVGKGLAKDDKAQKLALQHWLEAIDPRHRYGHNLHFYYDVWFNSKSTQPFFYWLDIGDGKEINLERCSRVNLQKQCIVYLGPKEREAYEVTVEKGKLVYLESGALLNTEEGSKWIFVLSTSRGLYVGQKKKGVFQHSSFLCGAATSAAGRLVAHDGVLEAIWPYSGHYLPTEDNFKEFISFLEEHNVDLTNVKRCSIDEDSISDIKTGYLQEQEREVGLVKVQEEEESVVAVEEIKEEEKEEVVVESAASSSSAFELSKRRLSCKWNSGVGPRIGCVRDYPTELQFRALEQVNLSPRVGNHSPSNQPIPSPRPSPKIRLSPRLSYMGLPSPRLSIPSSA